MQLTPDSDQSVNDKLLTPFGLARERSYTLGRFQVRLAAKLAKQRTS